MAVSGGAEGGARHHHNALLARAPLTWNVGVELLVLVCVSQL
jgi:hypothetical protein